MCKLFDGIDYFSATTDVWSRSNRSFIAVSVHFIDKVTNELRTEFIACEYFPGHHTHERVAQKLCRIFNRFGILKKVYFITTDSASEYVAACKYFGDDYRSIQRYLDEIEPEERDIGIDQIDSDSDSDSDLEENDFVRMPSDSSLSNEMVIGPNEQFVIHDISGLELNANVDLANINRIACSSHMLDKVGSLDTLEAKKDVEYAAMYDTVFGKLKSIWDLKASRLHSEEFERITKKKLIGPHRIRWLKTFDAVGVY